MLVNLFKNWNRRNLKARGVKDVSYNALRETKVRAVLIRIGFTDNGEDNNLFDENRNEIIKLIAKVILVFV